MEDVWNEGYQPPGELPLLCDFGQDFWEFITNSRCVGTHAVIFAGAAQLESSRL